MFRKTRSSLISSVIIAVLVLSAIGPTIVYADGGTTDVTPTETSSECTSSNGTSSECTTGDAASETPAATEEVAATETPVATVEAPATEVPVATEEAPVTEAPVATEEVTPAETPVASTCTSSDAAATDASSTDSSACSTDGESAPVAGDGSAEAATPASTGEVVSAEPAPASDTSVLDEVPENTTVTVLNAEGELQPLATQAAADAISQSDPIWCPAGQAPTPGANGCTSSFNSFNALLGFLSGNAAYQGAGTIYVQQGTYTGGESSIDFNSYDLSNIQDSDLSITGGWNTSSNVVDPTTTSDFNIPILIGTASNPWGGSLTINNISINGTNGTGLTLYAQNDINLTNVSVTNSMVGSELDAGGNVTIDNSKFIGNYLMGAKIRGRTGVAISNTEVGNPSLTVGNQDDGLDITSDGSVSLFNVLANNNRESGAIINAGGRVTIVQSVFSGTKATSQDGSIFYGFGLQVITPDIIDLDTVTATDNFLWGASLDAGGDVNIANSSFNANTTNSPSYIDDTGLLVTSGGNVSLNNVTADDNRLIGATIDAAGDVSINNSSFSNNNGVTVDNGTSTYHGYGLNVTTPGNIFINVVTASNNTLFGAHLDAGGDVTVSASDFSNQTSDSPTPIGRGLEVISGGDVFLDNVTLNNNQTFGANLQATRDVYLDTVTATGNGGDGIALQAVCTHLIGGTFSGNGGYGLNLGTSALDQVGSPTFGNNTLGDLFPQAPVSCAPALAPEPPPANPGIPAAPSADEGPGTLMNIASQPVPGGMSNGSVSLSSYLANTRTGSTSLHGIFVGIYVYVDTDAGLQIFAIDPDVQYLAMSGS